MLINHFIKYMVARKINDAWIKWPIIGSVLFLAVQVGLGGFVNLSAIGENNPWFSGIHMGISLLILGLILFATVISFYRLQPNSHMNPQSGLLFQSPFTRLVLATGILMFFTLLIGSIVKSSEAASLCHTWPLCGNSLIPEGSTGSINLIHRSTVIVTGFMVLAILIKAWRTQRTQTAVFVSATLLTVLFFSQALLGAKLVQEYPQYLVWLHQATAVSVWGCMVFLITAVGIEKRTTFDEKNDYARAGVPMLPVVRGEKETRWQILIYTFELVALSLALPLFGLGSSVYFVGAMILGGWLLSTAYRVWKVEENKVAWKMYRYSSMYLAFLSLVLMIDRLMI